MPDEFQYDVFLSHSAKDKAVVRELAERLRTDGLKVWFDEWEIKPGDSIPAKIEEGLEQSRVLVLCTSANAFGSDWAQLESGTFRFRDPLNKDRRFIPLRLDDGPIKDSLAQFLYINWRPENGDKEYPKLLAACRPEADARALTGQAGNLASCGPDLASLIAQKDRLPSRSETLQIGALELCAKLREVPPLREEELKQDYRGFWVIWWTTLFSASKHPSNSELCWLQLHPAAPEGLSTPIECIVRMADYPILRILHRGARIRVKGQIGDFGLFNVSLENATFEFPEAQMVDRTALDDRGASGSNPISPTESKKPLPAPVTKTPSTEEGAKQYKQDSRSDLEEHTTKPSAFRLRKRTRFRVTAALAFLFLLVVAGGWGYWYTNPSAARLAVRLVDVDPSIREDAVNRLGWKKRDAIPYVPAIVELLKEKDARLRWRALDALYNIAESDPQLIEGYVAVFAQLLNDPEKSVRSQAVAVLARIGESNKQAIIGYAPKVMSFIEEPGPDFVTMFFRALGKEGISYAPALTRAVTNEEWRVRCTAIHSLTAMDEKGELVGEYVAKFLEHDNFAPYKSEGVVMEAFSHFSNLALVTLLNHKNGNVRSAVTNELRSRREERLLKK